MYTFAVKQSVFLNDIDANCKVHSICGRGDGFLDKGQNKKR